MSKFEVGEVAIFWCPGNRFHNTECTIMSELHHATYMRDDVIDVGWVHEIMLPERSWYSTGFWVTTPEYLRKRRPPQDWVKLCNLQDAPAERAKELA